MSRPRRWWPSRPSLPTTARVAARRRRRRDAGFTLPELLVSISVSGMIMAALSVAVIAVITQTRATTGRLNNSRSTQNVNLWMPSDLASAEVVSTAATSVPCTSSCPSGVQLGGSNTLMLTWSTTEASGASTITTTTNVSYRYVLVGTEYQLIRVRCQQPGSGAWTCTQNIVIHGLDAPPTGSTYRPGQDSPTWVMQISEPPAPDDSGTGTTVAPDPTLTSKNARRVVVTINGGGATTGGGGGRDTISVSAGGTDRQVLDKTSLSGVPSFVAVRTRCGGNITLIVDESGSIGSTAIGQVRTAIKGFVTAFAGTPVQLQIVRFSTTSAVLGTSNAWTKYFNMLNDADVTALSTAVDGLTSNGHTNWEDGWFRTFYNSDGTLQAVTPRLVVFFTDGVPTASRLNGSSAAASTAVPAAQGYPLASGTSYNQEAWYRANYIAQQFRATVRFIGVGVGPDIGSQSNWLTAPIVYERGYHTTSGTRIYTSPYTDWETVTKTVYDATASAGRRSNTATVQVPTVNSTIIARLIAGDDVGVPATSNGTSYTNPAQANMYVLPSWDQFGGALKAVALAECGGTLTLQTQLASAAAPDPFTYQNTALTSSTGQAVTAGQGVVTTTRQFVSGTFDLAIPSGTYLTVEIQPQNLSDLATYRPSSWSCKAGNATRSFTTFPITGTPWTGIRVQVAANEAVSCVQTVTRP